MITHKNSITNIGVDHFYIMICAAELGMFVEKCYIYFFWCMFFFTMLSSIFYINALQFYEQIILPHWRVLNHIILNISLKPNFFKTKNLTFLK